MRGLSGPGAPTLTSTLGPVVTDLGLKLFDTARGAVFPVELRERGKVSMYVCGPTVYGPPHLGHGRFALVFDVLRRYLEWRGLEVTYVSNITDIDDKIIERGQQEGRDPAKIAQRCEAVWWDAMDRVNVKRPTHDPHATAYVEGMVALVEELVATGKAYETSDGVYLDAGSVPGYGLLARQDLDSLRAGARVESTGEKRSPVDFVLWKKAKPGEPTWPSPWGPGRPGWHTECVVMSLDLLGDGFDLHGGGQDLAFPHHENERAQAVASGRRFANHWVHNGFVEVGGEKMSKSLGNFTNLLDLTDRHDARAYRLLVLRSHYRSPVEVTQATIEDATRQLDRMDAFARRTRELVVGAAPDEAALAQFRTLMDEDLNTPGVVDLVSRLVRQANTSLDVEDEVTAAPLAAAVREVLGAVGLELHEGDSAGPPEEVLALVERRAAAKAARDFATADRAREEIRALGWIVEDTAKGATLRRG
ncbi:MAG: cysteine--tRNA ligase [Acidimicrobiia bacterium]|nr:cysteine--tRNA ligase [Acidimicrobiia bacterium]